MILTRFLIRQAYSVEMLGAGFYETLSVAFSGEESISQAFKEFGKEELKHAVWYEQAFKSEWGHGFRTKNLWIGIGKIVAKIMLLFGKKRLFIYTGGAEKNAVKLINKGLAQNEGKALDTYWTVAERTLADEKKHANWFDQYHAKP